MDKEQKYSLNCNYYKKEFSSIALLMDDIQSSGMDPNYEIMRNGKGTGEEAIDHIVF